MYNNPYYNSAQLSMDRIDNQIKELENMRAQVQRNMQPAINQTFQISPNNSGIKFVESISDVEKELVMSDSIFVTRDFTTMWLKTIKGEIRTFQMKEVVQKDEKDLVIEELQKKIKELEAKDEQCDNTDAPTEGEDK